MLEVGGVFAKLGAKLDDSGFNAYERRLDSARRDARNDVEADLKTDVDTRGFDRYHRDLNRAESSTKRSTGRMGGLMRGAGLAIASGAAVGGAAAAILGKKMIDSATAVNESLSKNKVLFGEHADAIDKWSETTATGIGISRQAALEATGTFGNLFVALDIGPEKAAKMSTSLTELAADLASFNNASPEEALEAIRSGLVGETEPLRRFGVNLNDATLRTQALHMGLVKSTTEALDPQTKALAVNALLFKQTEKAQGDFERTSGGLANQQRILKAQLSDVGSELGAKLLPIATKVVTAFNDLISGGGGAGGAMDKLRGIAVGVGDAIGAVVGGIRDFVGENRDTVASIGDSLRRQFESIVGLVTGVGKAFGDVFGGESGIGGDLKAIGSAILTYIDVVQKLYAAVVERALPGIVTAFKGLAQTVRGVIRIISGILTLDFGKVMAGLGDLVGGPLKIVAGMFRAATAAPRALAAAIGSAIGRAIGFVAELPGKIAGFLVDLGRRWLKFNIDIRRKALEGIRDAVVAVVNFAKDLPGKLWNAIKGAVRKWVDLNVDLRRKALEGIRDAVVAVVNFAKDLPGKLWNAIKGGANRVGDFGRALARKGVAAGKDLVGAVVDTVRDLPGKMFDIAGNVVDRFVAGISKLPGRVKDAIVGVGGFIAEIGSAIATWVNDNTIMGDSVHIGIPGPIGDINFTLPALARGGRVGPRFGGARAFIAGDGREDEWVISQEGDRAANVRWAREALEALTGRDVILAKGGKGLGKGKARAATELVGYYERTIEDKETDYGQLARRYDISEEEFLVERDGEVYVDQEAIDTRAAELDDLIASRTFIRRLAKKYYRAMARAIVRYGNVIGRLRNAIGALNFPKGRGDNARNIRERSASTRSRYRSQIDNYEAAIEDLAGRRRTVFQDLDDYRLDIKELKAERKSVKGTAAPAREPAEPDLFGPDFLTAGQDTMLGTYLQAQAAAGVTPDEGDDEAARADLEAFWRRVLAGDLTTAQRIEALGQLSSVLPQEDSDSDSDKTTSAPTAAEIAAAAIAEVASFQGSRAALFGDYGANFITAAGGFDPIAGTRYFGGGTGGTEGGTLAGGGAPTIQQDITLTIADPGDAHIFTQAALYEAQAAI